MIAFIGSVFSPWYRWSGRRDPHDHVCINVATYGPGGRFAMTDRGRPALRQSADTFEVGPSALHWDGDKLVIEVNEVASPPLVARLRGRITLRPSALSDIDLALTPEGGHRWRPFAPVADIEVELSQGHRWRGHGYFDANFGTSALEADFRFWTWGRFPHRGGATCFYDAVRADGSTLAEALHFDASGEATSVEAPALTGFRRSLWAVRRETRADAGTIPRQRLAMLDAPFYCRSLVETCIHGERTVGVHEALDLRRFKGPWLMPMLALRVPRRRNWNWRCENPGVR